MNHHWSRWWLLLLLVPIIAGLARLHFDVEMLDLLPANVPAVQGLKIYQEHFTDARELIVTVRAPDRETAGRVAKSITGNLSHATNLVASVTWQPPWLEHPEQTAELIAYLWLNQPPEKFAQLAGRLTSTNLANVLTATRDELATTMSPNEIAQLSYDPFGLTRLPENVAGTVSGFGSGEELFASADGTFRILFVKSRDPLNGYRECTAWFNAVKKLVGTTLPTDGKIKIGYTGRPAFTAEISGSMQHDMTLSVGGTAVIIAILFLIAHRRIKPMLWLLTLLALILAATLALGGLIFGAVNVISMGFAAILLGLAVDYAVVHYQEALAQPELSIPQIRRAIAPSIFWAATTTISAFLVLNFGGLPGLAQLGSLVGIGVAISACVMIFAFLPPLFLQRMKPQSNLTEAKNSIFTSKPLNPLRAKIVFAFTIILILGCAAILFSGLPKMDNSADSFRPRDSQAYATLDAIQENLNQKREPLWLVISGGNESEVAQKLDAVLPTLNAAVTNQTLSGFTLPNALWPRPNFQAANRANAQQLADEFQVFRAAALTNGFSADALGLTKGILETWQRATASQNVFWPTNPLCTWIFEKLAAHDSQHFFAVGFLYPATNATPASFAKLDSQLPRESVWLSGWELLGGSVLAAVQKNLWKLLLPMAGLILLSLWLAFRRFAEVFFSLGVLLFSGLCLLAVMKVSGWSWNLFNLMALPLILGTGVDYSIFMQLALRRHGGDLKLAHQSVGRALLLCGGTAIAGFGTLGLSSNAGLSGLGRVCAVGIAGNMLISVFLLPTIWKFSLGKSELKTDDAQNSKPSQFYSSFIWRTGLALGRFIPAPVFEFFARLLAAIYWRLAAHRREIVIQNLLPALNGDRPAATRKSRELITQFFLKITDLWRYESGVPFDRWLGEWNGWEHFQAAHARGKGVLLVTPHLGNWEFGGAFLVQHGYQLLVLTQPEPDQKLTELRQQSRAQRGVETLVVGEDAFAFIEIIKRLQAGATVALLVDRPPATTAVNVNLFGQPFPASIAAAELARASGCAIVPVYIVRQPNGHLAHILPEIIYDRAAIGNRDARVQLTQEILRAFEPAIRQHLDHWFHFVPVWPVEKSK
ncbi:MAG TPA: MMPL family transporter [Verrucomicrobiae bacterium]|jgi:predicted exporter/lauroyl/myristoyl acyltransferase|nr:MMPL family transporter [Verrucomicrobiae bacterium]